MHWKEKGTPDAVFVHILKAFQQTYGTLPGIWQPAIDLQEINDNPLELRSNFSNFT